MENIILILLLIIVACIASYYAWAHRSLQGNGDNFFKGWSVFSAEKASNKDDCAKCIQYDSDTGQITFDKIPGTGAFSRGESIVIYCIPNNK